jgi:hypothetical protein
MDLLSYFAMEHADSHSGDVYGRPTSVDRVFGAPSDAQMRVRPATGVNSLVWLLWHMARTEDVAVNLVVSAGSQVFDDVWARRMNVTRRDMGSGMTDDEVDELTARADIAAVRGYRSAVGLRTREVVRALRPEAWDEIIDERDIARAAPAIGSRDYPPGPEHPWCGNSRARRLSGAAVGHNRVHLGEAITISGLAGFGLGTSVVAGYRERLLVDGGYTAV